MLSRISSLWALALMAAFYTSCSDETGIDDVDATNYQYQSVNDVLAELAPTRYSEPFDASIGIQFTTARGSTVSIPGGVLQTADGQLALGQVTLDFQEIFTKADMMGSGVLTVSNQFLLNSGGAYYVGVSQAGEELEIRNGSTISVRIPQQAVDPEMELFLGEDLGTTSNTWQSVDSTVVTDTSSSNQSSSVYTMLLSEGFYNVVQSQFSWINCDAYDYSMRHDGIGFNLMGVTDLDFANTRMFGFIAGQNSVYQPWTTRLSTFSNSRVREYALFNLLQTVVFVSYKGGKIYFGYTTITPQRGNIYPVQMTEVTLAQIQTFLLGL